MRPSDNPCAPFVANKTTMAPSISDLAEISEFFADCGPLIDADFTERLQAFVHRHSTASQQLSRPIAVVTSGGTTVPLERNCVRFIDNFSAGTRGAMSTEQFLQVCGEIQTTVDQISILRHISTDSPPPQCRRLAMQ